jgi:hypothetical protein
VIRYLKGILDNVISYVKDYELELYGYSDLDWAGSIPNQKSTSTYCFSLGSNMVSWRNKKQLCVALSTTKVEHVQ